jgi:hexosaminidase
MHIVSIILILLIISETVMAQNDTLQGAGWQVRYRNGQGIELRVMDVPISRGSSVQFASPDWKKGFYSSNNKHIPTTPIEKGFKMHHDIPADLGSVSETVRKVDEQTLEWTLDATWHGQEPAILEWTVGYWNAYPFTGAKLQGEGQLVLNQLTPRDAPLPGDLLFQGTKLNIQTRVGNLQIQHSGDGTLAILDGRKNPERGWSSETPSLWAGVLALPLERNRPVSISVRFILQPKPARIQAVGITLNPPLRDVPNLLEPVINPPQLIPMPQVIHWAEGVFALSPRTRLLIESAEYLPAAASFQREIETRYGWKLSIHRKNMPEKGAIFFGGSLERQRTLPVPDREEAYCLKVTPAGIQVIGRTPSGTYYGAQTLCQLVQIIPNGLQVTAVTITDYPHMAFRGVHLLGGTQPAFHERLIQDVLSHFKLNHLIFECEYTQWETNPKMWVDFSMPKPVVKQLVETARAHYIEPIPLIESLGHGHWIFKNGANIEIAEDPDTPWAYCPRRLSSYEFIFSVYDEAIELFKPNYFHIGHDEVTMRGKFPHCPECKDATVAELFVEDVRRLHTFLRSRGVERLMMWSDMLLATGEANDGGATASDAEQAAFKRAALPKDIIQCDWHYTPAQPENYTSLNVLKQAGFNDIIATTWYQPQNIYTFAQAARNQRILGLLQSTWAGFNLTEVTLNSALQQFAAYLLAAEYAWNSASPAPKDLLYRAETAFVARFFPERIPLTSQKGFVIDLRSVYNTLLADNSDGTGWTGYGSDHDLQNAPTGEVRFNGTLFQLAGSTSQPSALMLAGNLNPATDTHYPKSVRITLGHKAGRLTFLHCTGWQVEQNKEVAQYIVHFVDGTQEIIPLLYGIHIRAWDDEGMAVRTRIAWEGRTQVGKRIRLRTLTWQNPHPNKRIDAIEFRAVDPVAAPVLLGLSGRK